MSAQGLPVSIAGVARAYADFLDVLIVDNRDARNAEELRKSGLRVHCTHTVMRSSLDKMTLAKAVLDCVSAQDSSARSATE